MSPQPAAPPAEPKAEPKDDAAEQEWNELVDRATSTGHELAQEYVKDAIRLEGERAAVMAEISVTRDMLRNLDKTNKLNDDQAEFIDVWFPEKERGQNRSRDDIEATRRAKLAARRAAKNGATD